MCGGKDLGLAQRFYTGARYNKRDGTEAVPYEVALMRRGDFKAVIRPAKIQKTVCRRVRQTVFNYPR